MPSQLIHWVFIRTCSLVLLVILIKTLMDPLRHNPARAPGIACSNRAVQTAYGSLLVTGSFRFGEGHQPQKEDSPSLSDLDLLWVSSKLTAPPPRLLRALTNQALHDLDPIRPVSISWKHVDPRRLSAWPAWLTNTWLASWRGISQRVVLTEEKLAWNYRPISEADVLDALDTAWRYAAMGMAPFEPDHREAEYAAAKLVLVLMRLNAQKRSTFSGAYRTLLELNESPQLGSSAKSLIQAAYMIKTGTQYDGVYVEPFLLLAIELTPALTGGAKLDETRSAPRLARELVSWVRAREVCDCLAIVHSLTVASSELPNYDAPRLFKYQEATKQWQLKSASYD